MLPRWNRPPLRVLHALRGKYPPSAPGAEEASPRKLPPVTLPFSSFVFSPLFVVNTHLPPAKIRVYEYVYE